ncbi:MAG TPA: 3-hydroxyacyl-CoA dehydrogenase NAD-binding domain-containing protein [Steroidobacteraceae bacterium]|nr:3-hydroxyacyl-CoA dehydrogenase NAD-binding domain-containing protein [Steroidobacteraceae bacterium]
MIDGRAFRTAGVIGAGTMGSGIAIVLARAGIRTLLFDLDSATLHRARERAERFLQRSVELGKLSGVAFAQAMSGLVPCSRLDELAACDLIIEAVFESRATKQALLQQLHSVCRPETILATNTSTLSVSELASASGRADRVVGLHFCLPAERMRLVEVTPAITTSTATLQAAVDFCESVGQQPVVTQDRPGFILNALAIPLNNSAIRLVETGVALPASIDTALKYAFGHAMGPLELLDLVGLDTQVLLSEALHASTNDARAFCPSLLRRMTSAGRLGAKRGGGFHTHFPETLPEPIAAPSNALSDARVVVLQELGPECLAAHLDDGRHPSGVPVIGFAPYDAGCDSPPRVVELVVSTDTPSTALAAALGVAQSRGLIAVVCRDRPGRILDRLMRPYLNDALRCVDEELATATDIDFTVRMGLGFREGPIELAERSGLLHHFHTSRRLHEALGEPAFVPARRARMAYEINGRG